jgi:hypothetical protein
MTMRIEEWKVPGPEQVLAIEREARRMRAEVIMAGLAAAGRWVMARLPARPAAPRPELDARV